MAGYGNRNAPDLNPEDLTHEHSNTRFGRDDSHAYSGGHETYGSGATAGVGFGNKTAPNDTSDYDNSDLRFGSHQETAPYSGGTRHGSGTSGGAGYGNKTSDGFEGEKQGKSPLIKLLSFLGI